MIKLYRLEAQFVGYPSPDVVWMREGGIINPSRDFQITVLPGKTFLYIPEVFPEDAGSFSVRITNMFGMAECHGFLVVQGTIIDLH